VFQRRHPKNHGAKESHRLVIFEYLVSLAYAHIPKQQGRKKLDAKGEKCVFVGYSEHMKAYKIYDTVTNKVFLAEM